MATDREWATGYFQQAASDMRAASELGGAEPSVVAMLVQMALEKFGKAALLRSGQIGINNARGSHRGASLMARAWPETKQRADASDTPVPPLALASFSS